jgi:hypothetical protein
MNFAYGKTLTLVSTITTTDPLGDSTTIETETSWGPCAVAPRYATESTDPRVPPVIVGKVIYGPAVAIDSDDRIRIDGELYEVDGLPGVWESPFTGWAPGIEVPVKRASSV